MFSDHRRHLMPLVAIALLLFVGCQSSPEAEDDPQPAESDGPETQAVHPAHQQDDDADDKEEFNEERAAEVADQISDEDLEMFARGVRAVAEREAQLEAEGRDLETREEEAVSPAEVRNAEDEVRQEMEDALAEVGLRFEDFLVMGQFIQPNPFLRERLEEFLDEEEIDDFFGDE